MEKSKDFLERLLKKPAWTELTDPIWLWTSFECKRNLASSPFPGKLSKEQSLRIYQVLSNAIKKYGQEDVEIFSKETLSPLDMEILYRRFFCFDKDPTLKDVEGAAFDVKSTFFLLLNQQDHLTVRFIDTKGSWESSWKEFVHFEETLGQELVFAFSNQFGFLTADPGESGTALRITVYLHVPLLSHFEKVGPLIASLEDVEGCCMAKLREEFPTDYVLLKNRWTLGVSEEEILRSLHTATLKLVGEEKLLRNEIMQNKTSEMKDKVRRAYGLLLHSYRLSTKEAAAALSTLKLAIHLLWIEGMRDTLLCELLFQIGKAPMIKMLGKLEASEEEIEHARSIFLQKTLSGVKLGPELL